MFKNTVLGLALATLAASSHAVVAAGAEIHFSPSADSVLVGDLFDVVLQGANFDATSTGEQISSFLAGQFIDFSYTSTKFQILSISFDPRWNTTTYSKIGIVDQAAGTVKGFRFGNSSSTPDDNFDIATFHLKALTAGPGSLALTAGTFIGTVNAVPAQAITVNMQPFQVQVSAVPEPSQWAILLLGLGIVGLRLRRR